MNSGPVTLEQAYALAVAHHQAGRLAQAENIYRQILAVQPEEPGTLHLLGLIEHQAGRSGQAVRLVERSLEIFPSNPTALSNLGEIRKALGQWEEARACYERALVLDPGCFDARNNLGTVALHFGNSKEAREHFERAIALQPGRSEAHFNLGVALGDAGRRDEAISAYRQALALRPAYPEAHNNLALALAFENRLEEACAHYRQAIAHKPDYAEAHGNLGLTLIVRQRLAEARTCCERSLALDPRNVEVLNNLAHIQQQCGQLDDALTTYRHALTLQPGHLTTHSNLIYSLQFHPGTTPAVFRTECERWTQQHAAPRRATHRPHANSPDPDRRLKVGYVSADLHDHPVSQFLLPLLATHDRRQVEVHAYASVARPDETTARLRAHTDVWHDVAAGSDETLAARVRADGIDILVDLALHSAYNRLPAFAHRPAPVQVSWLGYAGTTGLDFFDARLTDARIEPPDWPDLAWAAERPLRLPDCWCCFAPGDHFPPFGPLPASRETAAGVVTFGALNQFAKGNATAWRTWARLLADVPDSRLLISCPEENAQTLARGCFDRAGIATERVRFVPKISKAEYLKLYADWVDIGLDPWPHNGMTTTCEALWMGVPVVSLAGRTPVSRTGLSLLSCVGLPELVAQDEDGYIQVARQLAQDLPRLAALRAGMRARLQQSPLLDAPRFARHVETAYRHLWHTWCQHGCVG